MNEPLSPKTGWAVTHLFCKPAPSADREAIVAAVKEHKESEDQQVIAFSVLGHKADVGFMVIGPDLWSHRRLQSALQQAGLAVVDSYVSLTEISEYAPADMTEGMKRPRLYPKLPPDNKKALCFYPMSKRRQPGQNWYAESYERRHQLMQEHGQSGRRFSGRVVQLVTGSTGLDDYEWGVTLFGLHPDDLKDAVYTMRFDEASATYAEFGPFYIGMVDAVEGVLSASGIE